MQGYRWVKGLSVAALLAVSSTAHADLGVSCSVPHINLLKKALKEVSEGIITAACTGCTSIRVVSVIKVPRQLEVQTVPSVNIIPADLLELAAGSPAVGADEPPVEPTPPVDPTPGATPTPGPVADPLEGKLLKFRDNTTVEVPSSECTLAATATINFKYKIGKQRIKRKWSGPVTLRGVPKLAKVVTGAGS